MEAIYLSYIESNFYYLRGTNIFSRQLSNFGTVPWIYWMSVCSSWNRIFVNSEPRGRTATSLYCCVRDQYIWHENSIENISVQLVLRRTKQFPNVIYILVQLTFMGSLLRLKIVYMKFTNVSLTTVKKGSSYLIIKKLKRINQ